MNEQTLFAHRDSGHLPAELKIINRADSYRIDFRNEGGGGSDPHWQSIAFDRNVITSMVAALTAHLESLPPSGTFKCPICGVDSIHAHSGEEVAEYRIAAGAPAETLKPAAHKPPLPEADRLGPLGERLFLVGTLCNYGTACAIAAQPAPAPATDARELKAIDLGHGARLQRSTKTTGGVTWLMYNEHGLVRSLSVSEIQIVQATIAAMLSANSPREAG